MAVVADSPATRRPMNPVGVGTMITLYRSFDDGLDDLAVGNISRWRVNPDL